MARGFLLSGILSMASVAECARSNFAQVEAQAEAEDEQTLDASIPEPTDWGCADWKNTTYPIICSGMSGNGWECEPDHTGDGNILTNGNVFCPRYVRCSCRNVAHSGVYTTDLTKATDMCRMFWLGYTQVIPGWLGEKNFEGLATFLQPIEREICPTFVDACEEDCDSSWDPEKCKDKCTLASCLDDFPRYIPEWVKLGVGPRCYGGLVRNGMLGNTVLRTIAEYESLAKCCYRQNAEDGPKEFKWTSGNELVHSWRPDKWLQGRKACDAKTAGTLPTNSA